MYIHAHQLTQIIYLSELEDGHTSDLTTNTIKTGLDATSQSSNRNHQPGDAATGVEDEPACVVRR